MTSKSNGKIEEWKQLFVYETEDNNIEIDEYPEFIEFEWEEFLDAVKNGSMIPGEDGKAVVRWYSK